MKLASSPDLRCIKSAGEESTRQGNEKGRLDFGDFFLRGVKLLFQTGQPNKPNYSIGLTDIQ